MSIDLASRALAEGDHVRKVSGYAWPGKIVGICLNGDPEKPETRYVVRSIAPGSEGALHIFSCGQIEAADAESIVLDAIKQWLQSRGMCVVNSEGDFL